MTFWSALILGLVASTHCIGMCGGLQAALQSSAQCNALALRSPRQQTINLLALNIGRISSYLIAGLLVSLLGASLLISLNVAPLIQAARIFTGLMLILIGIQVFFQAQRPFHFIESLGARLWHSAQSKINHSGVGFFVSYRNGLLWGLLPCGLVYGVLLSTLFLQHPISGAMTMLGFGLGTLPALFLTGHIFQRFKNAISRKWLRLSAAGFFILGGVLVASAPYWVDKTFLQHYPVLLNSVFCLS